MRTQGSHELRPLQSEWPIEMPADWLRIVPQTAAEEAALRLSIQRSLPIRQGFVGAEDRAEA